MALYLFFLAYYDTSSLSAVSLFIIAVLEKCYKPCASNVFTIIMVVFILKLVLTPILITGATLAGRRWGPSVSGWLVGLPLTSGPVSFFLALQQGNLFATHAALGTLTGLVSVALYCLIYAWLSLRFHWLLCWLSSWGAFFLSTFVLEQLHLPLIIAFLIVIVALSLTFILWPQQEIKSNDADTPAWDLSLRIVLATVFVLLLTGIAPLLGPLLSGLLTPLPILSTILAVFAHRLYGASPARHVLRGVIIGVFAFAVFFLLIAVLLPVASIALTFVCAIFGALCTQGLSMVLIRRRIIRI